MGVGVAIGLLLPLQVSAVPISSTDAEALSTPAESLEPKLRDILLRATRALMDSRFEDAESLAREILAEHPDAPDALQILGYALANLKQYDEAISVLDKSADRYERNAGPLVVKGEILRFRGQREQSRQAFERALEIEPDNLRALENLGKMAIDDGEVERAIGYFETAARQLAPRELGVKPRLAELYFRTGQVERVQQLLAPWSDLPEGTPDRVIAMLARAAAEQNERAASRGYFEARLRRAPSLEAYVDFGTFHRNGLDFAKAERVFKQAADRYPDSAVPWVELGRTYGGEGRYEAALDAFNRGLEIAPGNVSLLKGVRLAQFRLGQLDAAQAVALRLASRQDAEPSDHVWLGSIERTRGNVDTAIAAYHSALEADPENWVALNNLAELLTKRDPDQAVALARQAVDVAGHVAAARDTLAWALFRSGDVSAARDMYAELTADAPEYAIAAYHYGRVLIAIGRSAEGRAELLRALELDNGFRYAEDARARLKNQ
ncbi:tetratricopeptide repeat protein [Marinobacter sp. TBZ242]|uniref:Tetratricopeptide repeat protein n=1 Tax=Marinobacter azerbaijanicus TaxID=3050455 RepID=A0ABT7I7K6_9GAMM|nr:tetratricopeptide repeat protein [Marinobacter sp. TBZ242]MDL0429732.1 tetratricopeptide repeat protein [Marinobacter sp. TBZ242]